MEKTTIHERGITKAFVVIAMISTFLTVLAVLMDAPAISIAMFAAATVGSVVATIATAIEGIPR